MRRAATLITGIVTWVWTIFTLYLAGRYGGAVLVDRATTGRIMGVRNDEEIHSAVGLTYTGWSGAALVVVELLLVSVALVIAMRRPAALRRAGLVVLVFWSLLWLGNAIWMERLTGGTHAAATSLYAVATAVVMAWTVLRWSVREPKSR